MTDLGDFIPNKKNTSCCWFPRSNAFLVLHYMAEYYTQL